ncbi:hypothetical protein LP419_25215 [Massilia sp. H-1]|nr:hypothetical protein LP419_25215 [Massilia sp. H-1]
MADGLMVQTFDVRAAGGTAEQSLAAYRKAETALLKQSGAVVAKSQVCKGLALPHAEWQSDLKGIRNSRYLITKDSDVIRVTIVASNAQSPRGGGGAKAGADLPHPQGLRFACRRY